MSKKVENTENIEDSIPAVTPDEGTYLADIVKLDDGFHVLDLEGNDLGVCKLVDEGKTLALPKNASNRQWYNLAKAEEAIAADGKVQLLYKASKTFGSRGTTIPDAKLIAYLSEDEQTEYKAIIDRAREKMLADKAKPVSELDKLYAKLKKTNEQIEAYKKASDTVDGTNAD